MPYRGSVVEARQKGSLGKGSGGGDSMRPWTRGKERLAFSTGDGGPGVLWLGVKIQMTTGAVQVTSESLKGSHALLLSRNGALGATAPVMFQEKPENWILCESP